MSAEIEYFRPSSIGHPIVCDWQSITAGTAELVKFLEPSFKLLVYCGIDNLTSTIELLAGSRHILEHLNARIISGDGDKRGKPAKFEDGKISIRGSQEIVLAVYRGTRRKKLHKTMLIYLSPDEDPNYEELPQEVRPLALV